MSQRVIGYEGEGRQRRPVYADEGAASVRVDGVAALGVLSATQVRGTLAASGGAGPVERREITAAEIDARRVVEARPSPIAPRPAPAPRPQPKEEPAVVDAAQDVTADPPPIANPFSELAVAAERAAEARDEYERAAQRWTEAQEALVACWRALPPLTGGAAKVPPRTNGSTDIPRTIPQPSRSRVGEGQRPGQTSERDRRSALVMAAMARLGDDQAAVAAELGMKKNAVAMVVKFARLRAGAPA